MFKFPDNFYTDVRIEDVFETMIKYTNSTLEQCKVRKYKGAFIRLFDGDRWYYSSTSEISNIQNEIENLANMAKPNPNIYDHPNVKKLEVNTGNYELFKEDDISKIPKEEKLKLLQSYFSSAKSPLISLTKFFYRDQKSVKEFYSSKGANLKFDIQMSGISIVFNMSKNENRLRDSFRIGSSYFKDLFSKQAELESYLKKCEYFTENCRPVKKGKYTVILSPEVTGVFAHESFGHKSEADFMVGDEAMKKEWTIGSKVGSEILSIVDDGSKIAMGFTPFDDEGTKAKKTYLINNGILSGRLHSAFTAADLQEEVTGNARALNFEFEPIVRMTNTFILPGNETIEGLISEVKEGILIENLSHGSGMSTFTIAPIRSYMIRDGKVCEPVNISVITGSVFETLNLIDGVSKDNQFSFSILGGCGKMEQSPLPVDHGGPYIRVKTLNVQ